MTVGRPTVRSGCFRFPCLGTGHGCHSVLSSASAEVEHRSLSERDRTAQSVRLGGMRTQHCLASFTVLEVWRGAHSARQAKLEPGSPPHPRSKIADTTTNGAAAIR